MDVCSGWACWFLRSRRTNAERNNSPFPAMVVNEGQSICKLIQVYIQLCPSANARFPTYTPDAFQKTDMLIVPSIFLDLFFIF